LLGEATVGTVDGVEVVTNRWQNRTTVDAKALKTGFPAVYEAVAGATRYRKLDRKPKRK
jgi:predicted phage-related endonuclease